MVAVAEGDTEVIAGGVVAAGVVGHDGESPLGGIVAYQLLRGTRGMIPPITPLMSIVAWAIALSPTSSFLRSA